MSCPAGQIRRRAYKATHRSTGQIRYVQSTCIKDLGKPGKTPASQRILSLDYTFDIELEPFGYSHIQKMKSAERQGALTKAIAEIQTAKKITEHESSVKVMRYLNVLSILNRNTNPEVSKRLETDRKWVEKKYLPKQKPHSV